MTTADTATVTRTELERYVEGAFGNGPAPEEMIAIAQVPPRRRNVADGVLARELDWAALDDELLPDHELVASALA